MVRIWSKVGELILVRLDEVRRAFISVGRREVDNRPQKEPVDLLLPVIALAWLKFSLRKWQVKKTNDENV